MRLIDADALKEHKVYSAERHEKVVPVANIYWMPTVDAAPVKHGRWEYIPGDGKFRAILICSRCRRNVGEYNRFNYCPHCGAKMDLEEKQHGTDQT